MYFFPRDFDLLKGLSPLTQYVYFSLWVFWNELQAEILRTTINRSKDIARKSKPKKKTEDVLNQMTGRQVKATLRTGKEIYVRLYVSPRMFQIIPKAFSNEIPWFFPLRDKEFCSHFNVNRRSLTGKNGARELLQKKNLIDFRVKWDESRRVEYKLLNLLENPIEFDKEVIRKIFYEANFSFSSKVLYFWFKKYIRTKATSSDESDVDDFNIQELRNLCGFDIKTIRKGLNEIDDLILI